MLIQRTGNRSRKTFRSRRDLCLEHLEVRHALSTVSFIEAGHYGAGSAPWDVTVGDFNGDGAPDLAVADFGAPASHEAYVLINKGDGTFSQATSYRAGAKPCAIHAADLNADGRPDLAVANGTSRDVSVMLNEGNGAFSETVSHEVGQAGDFPCGVTAADLNGDTHVDLAIGNDGPGGVSILLGVGGGNFSAQAQYDAGLVFPHQLTTVDLDTDGDRDLLVLDYRPAFSALWNGGDGTFFENHPYALGESATTGVAAGDVNGDDYLDFAVSWEGNLARGGGIVLFLGQADGMFTEANEYEASGPRGVVLQDVNNDGHLDLATTQFLGTVLVWAGNGDGTFADPESFQVVDRIMQDIVAADFDGDGRVDLATVGGRLTILRNTTEVDPTYLPGDANMDGSVDATDLNILALNWRQAVSGWSNADFNEDGRVDAIDLNLLALNWRKNVAEAADVHQRLPRAPLAKATVLLDGVSIKQPVSGKLSNPYWTTAQPIVESLAISEELPEVYRRREPRRDETAMRERPDLMDFTSRAGDVDELHLTLAINLILAADSTANQHQQ